MQLLLMLINAVSKRSRNTNALEFLDLPIHSLQKHLSVVKKLNTAIISKLENSSSSDSAANSRMLKVLTISAVFNITLNKACEVVARNITWERMINY